MKYLTDNGIEVITGVKGTVYEAAAQYKNQIHLATIPRIVKSESTGSFLYTLLKAQANNLLTSCPYLWGWSCSSESSMLLFQMISMKTDGDRISTIKKSGLRNLIFPGCVLVISGVVFVINPAGAARAFSSSAGILVNLMLPLSLVITLMALMNLLLKPAQIVRFLGKGSGSKVIILSATAGIFSMGPIYAWHPLLKKFREIGAKNSLIAVFIGNRAVKPFLLPIVVSYFGGLYVVLLTLFIIAGSLTVGYLVDILVKV